VTEKHELDRFAENGAFLGKMVPLQPGEKQPVYALDQPPEGFRWETDAEFRGRIKASCAATIREIKAQQGEMDARVGIPESCAKALGIDGESQPQAYEGMPFFGPEKKS
jgi:hypothetical protein